jgi:hypothetical protein
MVGNGRGMPLVLVPLHGRLLKLDLQKVPLDGPGHAARLARLDKQSRGKKKGVACDPAGPVFLPYAVKIGVWRKMSTKFPRIGILCLRGAGIVAWPPNR